jgi:hypothetical protein
MQHRRVLGKPAAAIGSKTAAAGCSADDADDDEEDDDGVDAEEPGEGDMDAGMCEDGRDSGAGSGAAGRQRPALVLPWQPLLELLTSMYGRPAPRMHGVRV